MADDELHGFAADARDAVTMAEIEARELGHARVGTEHLLLGLLASDDDAAAARLLAAGVTLAAARHKVAEAVGPGATADGLPVGALPRSARASRALTRAVRFSHARRAELVGSEHVLLGVLDVEGTAGQVLRGLAVDVDRLRSAFEDEPGAHAASDEAEATPTGPRCPSCGAPLDEQLRYHLVAATHDGGSARDALVFDCGACGRVLGVTPG
jgi:ATP-dependent Clp protease ATP-binding subunit ClpA